MVNAPQGDLYRALTTARPKPGERDDYYEEDGEGRRDPGNRADLVPCHLRERTAVPPDGGGEYYHVMHSPAECRAYEYPQKAGQIAELRGQHRAD